MSEGSQPYPNVPQQPKFAEIEEEVQRRWKKDDTFRKSIAQNEDTEAGEYVFYDGPPFANGLPHYGHLLTSFVKDTIPRYKTMRGHKVDRRFGWDCHGLPVEMEAERQLGFSGKAAIVDYGVERFNEFCRKSVMRYTGEWETTVTRAARWVDFENDYKTMELPYMESVMWAFKTLYDKGLAYEGKRVLPYCWECETPLSNFETRMDDAYRDRSDPAVTVWFELDNGLRLMVWTTTPWTLPSNLAIAVGPDIDYQVHEDTTGRYVVGAATTHKYEQQLEGTTLVDTIKGSELVGHSYTPLFDYFTGHENAFRILAGDFVSTEDGTGAVHMAPAFGEDDQKACEAAGISMVIPVDTQARFTSEVLDFAGLQVFDANPKIIDSLKANGHLVKREQYNHSYPHCWRSDTPLIYKALSSWFIQVTAIRDRMVELNQNIEWIPGHIRDGRFGKWIADARDWSISRNRFWGSPIPVWKSDDPAYPRVDVYGSLDELERDFGVRPANLHRPEIDQLTRPNPNDPTGKSTMRRVDDVLDCWFESGSMPYAQVHYPFENAAWFESHFPGDFIVEYQPQTRGWFYTLHVLATALFDTNAFKTCMAHGNVLGDDGRKMSKRLRNYPDVGEVFLTLGADATRWSLLASPVLRGGETLAERRSIVEASRQVIVPLWNAWYFFSLYANADGAKGHTRTDQTGVLDRYILAKTAELRDSLTVSMDGYDLFSACQAVTRYIDVLNNWWVRRSRERFWRAVGPDALDADKQDAYDTLATVLGYICRLTAPLLPMISDEIYTGLADKGSVHLASWPTEDELPKDAALVKAMDFVRDVCGEVLSIRKDQRLRVRLPLTSIVVATPDAHLLEPFKDLIADEVNVKAVNLTTETRGVGEFSLAVHPRVCGPRIGSAVQTVLRAAKRNEWIDNKDGTVTVDGVQLLEGEFNLEFKALDPERSRALPGNVGVVMLDTDVTPELAAEGVARDIVRLVQAARREAGFDVTDHIDLVVDAGSEIAAAVSAHDGYVRLQTLANSLDVGGAGDHFKHEGEIEGETVTVGVRKA